ncbi:DMT family transporter [Hoeflea sp. TYP-13]|uniref:DMT family transporter n=1 Tax=Hoeflea sp. TYP-13 TaxID=3230023 RepID=UPI0034C66FF0
MLLDRLAPALFVLLWSTGWIVARYAAPHTEPLVFLTVRYAMAAIALLAICLAVRAVWPKTRVEWWHAVFSGVLLHGIYLGGVWWAIDVGVPTAISGLIAALQPLMTAMAAPFVVGERLSRIQWAGIICGLTGLLIAIVPRLISLHWFEVGAAAFPLLVNAVAMVAVTAGSIYQKRYLQSGDLRSTAMLQYIGALAFTLPLAWLIEDMHITWNFEIAVALLWSVFGLSLGAIVLFLYLIRRGQVSRAASLIYLVPPAVAIEAFLLFGEGLTVPMIIGTIVVVVGVYLTNRSQPANA